MESSGPIPFAAFMEMALYDPDHGYYAADRSPWGRQGDYITAPQVSGALGSCIARLLVEVDEVLERPEPLDLVELGSGDGRLLESVLVEIRRSSPASLSRLRVHSVERGEASRARQRRRFSALDGAVTPEVVADVDSLPRHGVGGLLYSNELLDAFPVHRVRGAPGGGLQEAYVAVDEDGDLVEDWRTPSTPGLRRHLEAAGIELRAGQEAEVCLRLPDWLQEVARHVRRGYLLSIDYGHSTDSLYDADERPRGTLAAMSRYRLHDGYLESPGEQDLTAHVDLGLLRRAGGEAGLQWQSPCSLGTFLLGLGAAENAGLHRPGADTREHLALRHLLFSEIAHTHKAILQRKNAPSLPWGTDRLQGE